MGIVAFAGLGRRTLLFGESPNKSTFGSLAVSVVIIAGQTRYLAFVQSTLIWIRNLNTVLFRYYDGSSIFLWDNYYQLPLRSIKASFRVVSSLSTLSV